MEFFIFHFELHLISWPSLELCDSFLPFPPRPLFLVKESRAWLPLDLISAVQLPPRCRLVEEAGLRLEQSSIRNLQVAFVEAAVSCTYCCGYSMGAAGHREPGAGAGSEVLATTCAKAALKAEVVHCHRSRLQMPGFSVQACFFSKVNCLPTDVLRKECFGPLFGWGIVALAAVFPPLWKYTENNMKIWRCVF